VDLLANFPKYWALAQDDPKEQERLLSLMVVRVWVESGQITKLHLRPNIHIAAGLETKKPTEISVDLSCYQNGSDGRRIIIKSLLIVWPVRSFFGVVDWPPDRRILGG